MRSVRVTVFVTVLALVAIGSAYGFSLVVPVGPPPGGIVSWVHRVLPQGDLSEAEIVYFAVDHSGNPWPEVKLDLWRWERLEPIWPTEDLPPPDFVTRTDARGFGRFGGLEPITWMLRSEASSNGVSSGFRQVRFGSSIANESLTLESRSVFVVDRSLDGVDDTVHLHLMDSRGSAAVGSRVYINGILAAAPDDRGLFTGDVRLGSNDIRVEYQGESWELEGLALERPVNRPFERGPDAVLTQVAMVSAPLVVPLFAVVVAFDAVVRERSTGSIDLLLSRPVTRRSLALGKIGGVCLSVLVPVVIVFSMAVVVVAWVSGAPPSGAVVALFFAALTVLILLYTLLQFAFSALAPTGGTSLLLGILSWASFTFLWSVMVFFVASFLAVRDFLTFATHLAAWNPTGVYQLTYLAAVPNFRGSGFVPLNPLALPSWLPWLSLTLWISLLLILALYIFEKYATE